MSKRVQATEAMDNETFLKHINARHVPIGRMTVVGRSHAPGDEDEQLLRTYHQHLHHRGDVADGHTHREATEQ